MTSRRIYKYDLELTGRQELSIPQGGALLCVQTQGESPKLWVDLPDPSAPPERRVFCVFGTGHPLPDGFNGEYLGSCQMAGGALVWHIYEEIGR